MDISYFQTKLSDLCAQYDLPALGFALVKNGQETVLVSGVRKTDDLSPATTADKFHLGSCGKSVTAALIHQLMDEGYFDRTTTLDKLVPHLQIDPAYCKISVLELLTHTSGLPTDYHDILKLHEAGQAHSPVEARELIMQEILQVPPDTALGKEFLYSNIGYALLGVIAETATGVPYETLVQQKIFKPLGMTTAGFGAAADEASAPNPDQPWGHVRQEDGSLYPIVLDNPAPYAAVGTIHASLSDWAKFFHYEMQQTRLTQNPHAADMGDNASVYTDSALIKAREAFMHDGSNTMNYARVVLLPKLDSFFIIVTNDGSENARQAIDVLTVEIANTLKPKPPQNQQRPPSP